MRRTEPSRYAFGFKRQVKTALMRRYTPRSNSGFDEPYVNWRTKQEDLFRNITEAQYEHLRKVYRRQWYEAYIVNADEYITKYNITKAAQMARWESEMEAQEKQRRDAYAMTEGRQALKSKHLDILLESNERRFFHWYERASERLQYAAKLPFITRDKLDEHIAAELSKYMKPEAGENKEYPLNFVGQMPVLEDSDLNVSAAAAHNYETVYRDFPNKNIERYEPAKATAALGATSAAVRALDDSIDKDLMSAIDEMVTEKEADELEIAEKALEEEAIARRQYINRGRVPIKQVSGRAPVAPTEVGSPTIEETKKAVKQQRNSKEAREERRRQQEAFNAAQKAEGAAKPVAAPSGVKAPTPKVDAPKAEPPKDVKVGEVRSAGKLRRREATEEQIQKLSSMTAGGLGGREILNFNKTPTKPTGQPRTKQ